MTDFAKACWFLYWPLVIWALGWFLIGAAFRMKEAFAMGILALGAAGFGLGYAIGVADGDDDE